MSDDPHEQRSCCATTMNDESRDHIVQYLYVHSPGETLSYPTSRASIGAGRVATRYIECALVQSASLRFNDADCRLTLVTNLTDESVLGRRGRRLLDRMRSIGVAITHAEYEHRPPGSPGWFYASRYVLDAIRAIASRPAEQRLWFLDVDCVWIAPGKVLAAFPNPGSVGCIHMSYNIDWDRSGRTRASLEQLAGAPVSRQQPPPWVGGELLAGRGGDLLAMVDACDEIGREIDTLGNSLGTEEQLLTLAGALGRVRFEDMGHIGRRILTGPRHSGVNPQDPRALGLWHLPSEKGLGFRRAANAIVRGHTGSLERALADPARAMRRFNIDGGRWTIRRLRDDSWIAGNRLRELVLKRLART
jgi:hypothetical protein